MENKKWKSPQSFLVTIIILVIFAYIATDAFVSKPSLKNEIDIVKNEYITLSSFLNKKMPEIDSTFKDHASQIKSTQRALQETFFKTYYTTYPSTTNSRSSTISKSNTDQTIANAFVFYDKGNYKNTKDLLKDVLNDQPNNYMCKFYLAICEIELENYKVAERHLELLIKERDHMFWEQSHWYLAITYLNQSESSKARPILQKIIEEDMSRKSDAEIIIKVLVEV